MTCLQKVQKRNTSRGFIVDNCEIRTHASCENAMQPLFGERIILECVALDHSAKLP